MIRLFNHYLSVRLLLLTTLEAVVVFKAMTLGLQFGAVDASALDPLVEAGMFMLIMLAAMSALGLYQTQREPFRRTVQRLLIAYGLSLLAIGATLPLIAPGPIGFRVIAWGSLGALAAVLVVRTVFFRLTDLGLPKRRVLVLGNGMEAESVIRYLHSESLRRSVRFAGLYPVMTERDQWGRPRPLDHAALERTVARLGVSEIVVAVRERRGGVLPLRQLLNCKLRGVSVMDLPSFYEREQGILTVDSLHASWMIFGGGFRQGIARDVVKRLFDALVALVLIAATLPLVIVAIVAIAVESGFPVLYFQERVGQGGRRFRIVKLRTMRHDAERDGRARWAQVGDRRVTRVGALLRKSRIDELPQLWNVLRGEMSFVGPRPERPFFVDTLRSSIPFYDVRHSVKPGVTGWAQVRYAYTASVEDTMVKLQYDLYYVKNHSLFLDLMILVDTLQVILLGKGAR